MSSGSRLLIGLLLGLDTAIEWLLSALDAAIEWMLLRRRAPPPGTHTTPRTGFAKLMLTRTRLDEESYWSGRVVLDEAKRG